MIIINSLVADVIAKFNLKKDVTPVKTAKKLCLRLVSFRDFSNTNICFNLNEDHECPLETGKYNELFD